MLLNAGVFNSLTCKCASRHSGVQFFDSKPPKSGPYPSFFPHFDFKMCFAPQPRGILEHRNFQNGFLHPQFFNILPCKCASPHSGVPFLDIWTTKSGPRVWCFPNSDLQICFAPQRRAIFEHRNFQNGSAHVVFCAFRLTNMLRATAACHFWTSERPKWVRDRGVLCILTCKCASRHSGVQFLNIATSKMAPPMWVFCAFWLANVLRATAACHFSPLCPNSYLRTRRFSEATFRTSETTNHWKNTAIRDVTNIWRARWTACERLDTHVDLLASDLTDVDLVATDMTAVRLCFSTLHIVGS